MHRHRLRAVFAQVHRAQLSGSRAKPGLLVALRGVELHVARIDDLPHALECAADMLTDGENGWQYAFRITHAGRLLAEGRAAVMLQAGIRDPGLEIGGSAGGAGIV